MSPTRILAALGLTLSACSDPAPPGATYTGAGCADGFDCQDLPIAVGGTDQIDIPFGTATTATVEGPFTYQDLGFVRADAAGVGTLTSADDTWHALLESRPLARVTLGPQEATPDDRIVTLASSLAFHVSMSRLVLRLWDESSARLVDTSVELSELVDPRIAMPTWDEIDLPPVAGTYALHVVSGSFTRDLDVTLVDHVDRVELDRPFADVSVRDSLLTCAHAFVGDQEVAIRDTFQVTNAVVDDRTLNCIRYHAITPGTLHLIATTVDTSGATAQFDVPVAP